MKNKWKLALGLVGCLIAIWVITASDNHKYVVCYTTYIYGPNTDSLVEGETKTCSIIVDSSDDVCSNADILYEVWDYELSTSTIIVDSIDINVIQRVN